MIKKGILALAALVPGTTFAQQPVVVPVRPAWVLVRTEDGRTVRLPVIGVVVSGTQAPAPAPPAWSAWASPLEQAEMQAQAEGRLLTPLERNAAINAQLRQFAHSQQARWEQN